MTLKCTDTALAGVLAIDPVVFGDQRGFFLQTHHRRQYGELGVAGPFVQDNCSFSRCGAIRGLHYQLQHPQGKLIYVVAGEIFDVAVDIRVGSPTFGKWIGLWLSGDNHRQIYVPEGFAHGFAVTSESAHVIYKCTDFYTAGDDYGILWSDPDIGIDWPIDEPTLSDKDRANPKLADAPRGNLPNYTS